MRAQIAYSAILAASVLGSTLTATAQTGEFPLQVPGPIVHRGWEIQDQLQDARSGTPAEGACARADQPTPVADVKDHAVRAGKR
jgi:cell division septation protein DedD